MTDVYFRSLRKSTNFRSVRGLYSLLAISLAFLMTAGSIYAQPEESNHPELYWQTIETEHFLVHYSQGTERTANLVAKIAEEVYPHITGLYQYEPARKTEFVIRDTDDYSNGGAYFFDNKIDIWSTNLDFLLRGTHNWLRDVVTHEFTHIISLRKSFKFGPNVPAGWLQGFGYEKERRKDVVRGFPNVLVSYPVSGITIPVWFAEGVAQFQSPDMRFDYRDSHREMVLRDRVMTNHLLDLNEMSVFGKNSVGNESAYNQGFAFVRFLAQTFGDSVLRDIAHQASAPMTLRFESVLRKATGLPADSIYRMWKTHLEKTYQQRLTVIDQNLKIGTPIRDEGIGNVYPVFSPDGKKVAYLGSKSDYLSINQLLIDDLSNNRKLGGPGAISSSISWSPDGRYLVYSKQTERQSNGSNYNDLYILDTRRYKEYQISHALRASNPDWSHDGKRLVFVVQNDGITNLFTLKLDDLVWVKDKKRWHTRYYDLDNHRLVRRIPPEQKSNWDRHYRKVTFWGDEIQQLTFNTDGRQFFHPRWSPDDSSLVFDTSIGFCRDIARIPANGGKLEFILNEKYDERDPSFDPNTGELYFASDRTGIFNIYSYDFSSGEIKAHTNVVGGAFMPTVNKRGDMVYSLYKDQGYKVYRIKKVNELPPEDLVYNDNYEAAIPVIHEDDSRFSALPPHPYSRRFGPLSIMPRLVLDYGTLKPGLYIGSNEMLNKMFFFGGFDMNVSGDYDLFALFEFHVLKPTLFLEVYNQSTGIKDQFNIEGYHAMVNRDVNFNLLETDLGMRGDFRDLFQWQLTYILSIYRAKSGTFSFRDPATGQPYVSSAFRYTYLKGHAVKLVLHRQKVLPEVDRSINPRIGYYLSLSYAHEWNQFLDDFATDRAVGQEIFKPYNYNRIQMDFEHYFPVPLTSHHSLSLRFQGGLIDRSVDDFFNLFAGGLVGLKGYPFYSIEGRRLAIGTATYRFPLARHLNFSIFNWQLDKVYLGGFYQYGNAWSTKDVQFDNFKSDVGVQLRLETYSWYMFPTRIFVEAAYPLKEQVRYLDTGTVNYGQDWKFYFGLLFDFDLRFDKKLR